MRKLLIALTALLAALCLVTAVAGESAVYTLPIDVSAGMPLRQDHYVDADTYIDPTIEMHITEGMFRDTLYWVADVKIAHPSQLRTMPANRFTNEMTRKGKDMSVRANAVIAINGDFYAIEERLKGQLLLRQGELYAEPQLIGITDLLLIDEDGDFHFIPKATQGAEVTQVNGKKVINGFCFGPIMVWDGVQQPLDEHDKFRAADQARARTAICQFGPLHYAVVTCSNPIAGSKGMTLRDFSDLMVELGVQQAYNLDGGNSTIMYTGSRMVNKNRSLRNISDIIYFASAWPGEE